MSVPPLLETLRALEVALHQPAIRSDPPALGGLLHPGFREFGRSGASYTRAEVLAEFSGNAPYLIWAQDFALDELAPDIALLTYRSAHVAPDGSLEAHALRSSIWQRTADGWKMRFHQGTPAAAFERSEG